MRAESLLLHHPSNAYEGGGTAAWSTLLAVDSIGWCRCSAEVTENKRLRKWKPFNQIPEAHFINHFLYLSLSLAAQDGISQTHISKQSAFRSSGVDILLSDRHRIGGGTLRVVVWPPRGTRNSTRVLAEEEEWVAGAPVAENFMGSWTGAWNRSVNVAKLDCSLFYMLQLLI